MGREYALTSFPARARVWVDGLDVARREGDWGDVLGPEMHKELTSSTDQRLVLFPDGGNPGQTNESLEWSGRRGSNPQPTAWEAATLPLSYSRMASFVLSE